jgi:hypothetical protein
MFTQLLGSQLGACDYDPISKRVAVASASCVLHVLDPSTDGEARRANGCGARVGIAA